MSTTPALTLRCGADFWAQFAYTDVNGNPITITAPKMEIRSTAASNGASLYTSEGGSPTIVITQPSANVALCKIASATTKNQTATVTGYWDAYATDPNGNIVCLGSGTFTSTPNVTSL